MQFQFKIQSYQTDAVNAVIQVFNGQKKYEKIKYIRDVGISTPPKGSPEFDLKIPTEDDVNLDDATGYKNEAIELSDDQLFENIKKLQSKNNIKLSPSLVNNLGRCNLDVEMETGTGKTYVYIKTMFELEKRFGWSKFIVIVPSVAIREGVKKSFEITASHFMEQYGKKARFFVYRRENLTQLDEFSASPSINVMIINTQMFATSLNEAKNKEGKGGNAEARVIYSKRDEFGSRRPIDVIAANRPILILDEPQKMGGEITQKSLKHFKPLFTINYSATHKTQHNLVYVLDALEAYNKRLVKKIEVKGFDVKNLQGNNSYIYLEQILVSPNKAPEARVEIEVQHKEAIKREMKTISTGDDLFYTSKEMGQYKGYAVSEIEPIAKKVIFTNGVEIHVDEVLGNVSERDMKRIQIRETILSHFEKEGKNFEKGIKTLSLFFIDEVSKYRQYDENGNESTGEYGKIFEEEYASVWNEYRKNLDTPYFKYLMQFGSDPSAVHKGYFSIDKKTGHAINSKPEKKSEFSSDESAYNLILKNKERLLAFEEPTRFIFSHSALREGWDNPNVFQICTLKHSSSATAKRQEVGRGLRLCVNQSGSRMDKEFCGDRVHDINKLTVITNESYANFVGGLQKEIKDVLYDRPTKASIEYFEGKTVLVNGKEETLSKAQATEVYQYLVKNRYIDARENVTDIYRTDLANNCLKPLPKVLEPFTENIHQLVQGIFDESVLKEMFTNAHETVITENPLNENFSKKEFQTLWNYINHKYAYIVDFQSEELIQKSIESINKNLFVSQLLYTTSTGEQKSEMNEYEVGRGASFEAAKTRTQALKSSETSSIKYDLVGKIATGCVLTRKTVVKILFQINQVKFQMFRQNPEEFISKVIHLIKEQKATMIVEHISYNQIAGSYDSDIFTAQKNSDYTKAYKSRKNVQDFVLTDGYTKDGQSVERRFAEDLDNAAEVCVYAKLPKGFFIPTPVGNYTPDWAIAFNAGTVKHIFFVAETKGSMDSLQLKAIEKAKIECAKKLFKNLSGKDIVYDHVDSYQHLLALLSPVQ